jgi:hypothetical protein
MENGLVTKSSAPRSSARTLSASAPRTESTMIGTRDDARMPAISSKPSERGMARSVSTRSGACDCTALTPEAPSLAARVV